MLHSCFFPSSVYWSMNRIICANCYKPFQRLPKRFAMANGLFNKKRDLIIRDERQRLWNLRLAPYGSSVHVLGGWFRFCTANSLQEGDYMMFEVVSNGEKPIWKFHCKFSHLSNLIFLSTNLFTLIYTP